MSKEAPSGIRNGDWYAQCQVCGIRIFGSTGLVRYDNLFTCTDCYEERHPQDTLESIKEQRAVPIASPVLIQTASALNNPIALESDTDNWYGDGSIS